MKMRDRVLLALSWNSLTYSELAVVLGHKWQSIASANQHNSQMGFVDQVVNPTKKRRGPVRWKITDLGRERLNEVRSVVGIES